MSKSSTSSPPCALSLELAVWSVTGKKITQGSDCVMVVDMKHPPTTTPTMAAQLSNSWNPPGGGSTGRTATGMKRQTDEQITGCCSHQAESWLFVCWVLCVCAAEPAAQQKTFRLRHLKKKKRMLASKASEPQDGNPAGHLPITLTHLVCQPVGNKHPMWRSSHCHMVTSAGREQQQICSEAESLLLCFALCWLPVEGTVCHISFY